jgi:gamma-glutamyltranspeptidase/glutathione hydrolase
MKIRKIFLSLLLVPLFIESSIFNPQSIVHPQVNENGMVVSQHYLATNVGAQILHEGGNAYDASIAVAFALAVVLPRAGNIGGGGFMVMYDKETDESFSIDYREIAPALATKDMYLNEDGSVNKRRAREGILSIGVPGTVYGMWEVHKKFGSLEWKKLLQPAINLAEEGFIMTPFMVDALNSRYEKLSNYKNFKKIFYKKYPVQINKRLVQSELAKTLKIIAKNGVKGFYEGQVANKIAQDMRDRGGLISTQDLQNYRPVWRKPIKGNFEEYEIVTMGPPSSGGIHIIQMLNILENFNLQELGHNSASYASLLAEVMKFAYADRSKYLADPDFFDVPVSQLISKKYGKAISKKINLNTVTPSSEILPGMKYHSKAKTRLIFQWQIASEMLFLIPIH